MNLFPELTPQKFPVSLHNGNCLDVLKTFESNYFDAIITDPPYGINFMNKHWDYDLPSVEIFKECFRVLKPGAHMLVACGTRTQHRMAQRIESADFEIRDSLCWLYSSGMPKSMDISKQIDKKAGAVREVIGKPAHPSGMHRGKIADFSPENPDNFEPVITAPATEDAKKWDGWGTALKPAIEFWTLARKPQSNDLEINSSFFYCAKPSRSERDGNDHPTVKPLKLMTYLCKLITPPSGKILDPFMGSGSTGVAAQAEKFHFTGIELSPEYFKICQKRML